MQGRCNVCGKESDRLVEGVCPKCEEKLEGLSIYGGYMAVAIGLFFAAFKVYLSDDSVQMTALIVALEVAGWVFVTYLLYIFSVVATQFMIKKKRRVAIVWAVVVAAAIVAYGYTPKDKIIDRPSYEELEAELEQLESEYDNLHGDTVDIADTYYYLLEDLRDLQSDMERGYDYELDEFADRLDSIIYDYE